MTMSSRDDMPKIVLDNIPESERDGAKDIHAALLALGPYVREFEADLKLFKFCSYHLAPFRNIPRTMATNMMSWRLVAARDGAMNIYHIGQAIEALNAALASCPSLGTRIDQEALSEARKRFSVRFSGYAKIRHSVAHKGEFERDSRHWITEPQETEDGWATGPITQFLTILDADRFTTTNRGKLISYEITEETLNELVLMKRAYFDAFRPLETNQAEHANFP